MKNDILTQRRALSGHSPTQQMFAAHLIVQRIESSNVSLASLCRSAAVSLWVNLVLSKSALKFAGEVSHMSKSANSQRE